MQKVYMLGIGGAGMAAMAVLLRDMGVIVSGYDQEESDTVKRLRQTGIPVSLTADDDYLYRADCCVYSAAIPPENPLLIWAKGHIPTFSRGEMLGRLTEEFQQVIAVAGTHGKTTVCGMLTHILLAAGHHPSVLMGGHLPIIGGNGRLGSRKTLICEACEFAGSFLNGKRDIGIVLNVDNDHLEYYGNMENLKAAFTQFIAPCKTVIVYGQDDNAYQVRRQHPHSICFGYDDQFPYHAANLTATRGYYSFDLHLPAEKTVRITLQVPGKHNILNALAASAAAHRIGVSANAIQKGLTQFCGVARRFETVCRTPNFTVVDDYAHHPAEIQSVMESARQMGFTEITAIFQPFTYSRTLALHREFANALQSADRVILPPVMAGREPEDTRITSGMIAAHLPQAIVCADLDKAAQLAMQTVQPGSLILTLGCGNVYRCAQHIRDLTISL